MRKNVSYLYAVCTFGLIAVILSGCASSPPSKFYQLNAMSGQTGEARNASDQDGMVVVIGPLRIPDYLDRPQIVTRSGKNELKLAEFDRWAGSLENDIIRVLVEDVSAQLPADRFFVIRWTPLLQSQLPIACKVEVLVERLDGAFDGPVSLRAQWAVVSPEKGLLLKKESLLNEEVRGNGYDAYVNAMSRAIARLSKEMADSIVEIPAKSAKVTQQRRQEN